MGKTIEYPKIIIKNNDNKDDKTIEIDEQRLIDMKREFLKNEITFLPTKTGGSLQDKAFVLPSIFDWVIVKDDNDICLVPMKKWLEWW